MGGDTDWKYLLNLRFSDFVKYSPELSSYVLSVFNNNKMMEHFLNRSKTERFWDYRIETGFDLSVGLLISIIVCLQSLYTVSAGETEAGGSYS